MADQEQNIQDIAVLLNTFDGGKFRNECSKELSELIAKLHARAIDTSFIAKGKITLVLSVGVEPNGMAKLEGDVVTKAPKPLRGADHFYVSRNGKGLSRSNPKQPELPLRAVGAPAEPPRAPGAVAGGEDR